MCNEKKTCIMITFKFIPNFFFFLEPVSNHLTSQNQPHLCSSRSIFMVSRIIRSRFEFSVVTFAAHVPKWWYLCSFMVEHLNAFDFCRFFPQHIDSDTAFFPLSLSFTQCKAHFPSDSTLFEKIFINQRRLRSNHSWPACFTILSVCVGGKIGITHTPAAVWKQPTCGELYRFPAWWHIYQPDILKGKSFHRCWN